MYTRPHTTPSLSSQHATSDQLAPIHVHIEQVLRQYFTELDGEMPSNLYELILTEVEKPLLTVALEQTRGNQTRCAHMLGLNRGTLRKKMKTHGFM